MEPILTDEQRLLQDSVKRHLAQAGGVKRARSLRGKAGGFDPAALSRMADEGWLGMLVPPDRGGLGLGLTELALVLMEAGRALAPEPIGAMAVAALAIARGEGSKASAKLLESVIAGRTIVMPAVAADAGLAGAGASGVAASGEGGSLRLDGRLIGVPLASACDGFLIAARRGEGRDLLAWVPRDAEGVSLSLRETVDGRPFADLVLVGARPGIVIAEGANAGRPVLDLLLFCAAAELAGVMSAALDMTVEYLKTRQQFGKAIGSFQALQHRAVDDFTRIVSVRSFLFQVAALGTELSPSMASALKAHAGGEALKVTKSAIQMHGAIGFTDEYDVGLYLKRAMWLSAWLGNEAVHRKRYAALHEG